MDILDKINREIIKISKNGGQMTDLLLGKSEMKALKNIYNPTNEPPQTFNSIEMATPLEISESVKKIIFPGKNKVYGYTLHELKDRDSYFEGFDLADGTDSEWERFEELVKEK